MRRHHVTVLAASLVAVVGLGAGVAAQHPGSSSAGPGGPSAALALPDPTLTPGATDPTVTAANVATTICVSGYTDRVRPPLSKTEAFKRQVLAAYHASGPASAYELDHLIPLEAGGATSMLNLWPQPLGQARIKDRLENRLRSLVCSGRLSLVQAQQGVATDWYIVWLNAGRP